MLFSLFLTSDKIHHPVACLVQGLHDLGHEVRANYQPNESACNGICPPFSKYKPDYISATKNLSDGILIVDISHGWSKEISKALSDLAKTRPVVIINTSDGVNFDHLDESFYLFHAHYNQILPRKGKNYPMAFGLSKEIIEESAEHIKNSPSKRRLEILRNFRPSGNQAVRQALDLSLIPNLEKIVKVNNAYSSPQGYPNDLLSHQAVLCYGGCFYHDYRLMADMSPNHQGFPIEYDFKTKLKNGEVVIFRFDSWRFYEAALFEAAPITLDFERYGLDTGANPRPWVEYIPVEFDKVESLPKEIAARLKDDPDFLIKVGKNARKWVIKNHSPVAMAERFIGKLKEINII